MGSLKRQAMIDLNKAYKKRKEQQLVVYRPSAKKMISPDTGFVDLAAAAYAFDTTGSITLIATIPQGTTVNTRVGKKAVYRSIQMRGYCFNGTTATYNDCAIIMVYDRRPTGVLPAITDVLVSSTSYSMNNDVNSGRFQIVRRFDFELIGNITGVIATQQITESSAKSVDAFVSITNKPIVFKALGTGAIADIEEGALYMITVGNTNAGTGAANLAVGFRIRFQDT